MRLIEERDRVRSDVILTRLALARIVYDRAQTYEPGSKEWQELLTAAATEFGENYWKYNRWLRRLRNSRSGARCHKELGHYGQALQILEELASPQPNDDEGPPFPNHRHRDGPANRPAAAGEEVSGSLDQLRELGDEHRAVGRIGRPDSDHQVSGRRGRRWSLPAGWNPPTPTRAGAARSI